MEVSYNKSIKAIHIVVIAKKVLFYNLLVLRNVGSMLPHSLQLRNIKAKLGFSEFGR